MAQCPNCGASSQTPRCIKCGTANIPPPVSPNNNLGARQNYNQPGENRLANPRSKVIAILLAFFLGGLGIHWFYLGNNTRGIVYLILAFFSLTTIPFLLSIYDILKLAFMDDYIFDQRYNC